MGNEWRDIFTCVVTGPRFPLGASAVGSYRGFRLVNSNAVARRHRRGRSLGILYCAAA